MPLSYLQRPPALQAFIDAKYDNISKKPVSDWTYDLADGPYNLANFNEHQETLALVEERLKLGERSFYFLDAGAGFFTWGRYLAKFLTEQFRSLPFQQYGDFRCHIVSVSGESHGETTGLTEQVGFWAERRQKTLNIRSEIIQGIVEEDLTKHSDITRVLPGEYCTLYEFGNVKLENIQAILPQRLREVDAPILSDDLLDTFDFAISSSCLQHLVDGAGTLVQMLDMLKIDGIAQFHGFVSNIADPTIRSKELSYGCHVILASLEMPFFTAAAHEHFPTCFIQKNVSGSVNLPLEYNVEQELSWQYPRAYLTRTAGFSAPKFQSCSARYEQDNVTTFEGLCFYNTLTQLALKKAPIEPDNRWFKRMQEWQEDTFKKLSEEFRVDINRVKERSPLLPYCTAQVESVQKATIY